MMPINLKALHWSVLCPCLLNLAFITGPVTAVVGQEPKRDEVAEQKPGLPEGGGSSYSSIPEVRVDPKHFKGIIRITHEILAEDVVVHSSSSSAMVLSFKTTPTRRQGLVFNSSDLVLATTQTLMDSPNEAWYREIPEESIKHRFTLEQLDLSDVSARFRALTPIPKNNNGFPGSSGSGGAGGELGEGSSSEGGAPPGYGGGGSDGAPAGYGGGSGAPPGYGSGSAAAGSRPSLGGMSVPAGYSYNPNPPRSVQTNVTLNSIRDVQISIDGMTFLFLKLNENDPTSFAELSLVSGPSGSSSSEGMGEAASTSSSEKPKATGSPKWFMQCSLVNSNKPELKLSNELGASDPRARTRRIEPGTIRFSEDGFYDYFVPSYGMIGPAQSHSIPRGGIRALLASIIKKRNESMLTEPPSVKRTESGTGPSALGAIPPSEPTERDPVSNALAAYLSASSEKEKENAKSQVRLHLGNQFDAQRKTKKLEIEDLRRRLDALDREEQEKAKQRDAVIEQRLERLVGDQAKSDSIHR